VKSPAASLILFGLAGLLAASGAMLFALPTPARTVEPFASPNSAEAPMPAPNADTTTRLSALFDLSSLPEPVAPERPVVETPPPDPAEALKAYRYLGGASAGDRNAALFESGGVITTLKLGETLAGFTLLSFNADAANFQKGDIEAALQLIQP
jgi:hypothetical protein